MFFVLIYDKYEGVEGLGFIFSTIIKMGSQEIPMTITCLEIYKDINDELFN